MFPYLCVCGFYMGTQKNHLWKTEDSRYDVYIYSS